MCEGRGGVDLGYAGLGGLGWDISSNILGYQVQVEYLDKMVRWLAISV